MRTSLNETVEIENWLLQVGDVSDNLITEVKVLTNAELKEKAHWQSTTYELIRLHGKRKLLNEVKLIEHRLFSMPQHRSFQHRILSIFNL